MDKDFNDALGNIVLTNILDAQALVATRVWEPLREGVNISLIYQNATDGARAGFLHYSAGASVPRHIHQGFEHILILHGSQIDGDATYWPGTLVIHAPGSQHNIIAPQGCIALGIWEKPVQFVGNLAL